MHNYMGGRRVFFAYFFDLISTNLGIVASKCGVYCPPSHTHTLTHTHTHTHTRTHTKFHMEKYYLLNEVNENKTVL